MEVISAFEGAFDFGPSKFVGNPLGLLMRLVVRKDAVRGR